jgi:glutaconate CoA-transferase subunit B
LVEKLDFVTAAGNMATLVTPLAVFQRDPRFGACFELESWNPVVSVEEIVKRTGFKFDAGAGRPTPPPTDRETAELQRLDPHGEFAAKLAA